MAAPAAPDILGIGLSTLDVLIRTDRLPTWDVCGTAGGYTVDGGGMAATAMVAAAKLGARTAHVGVAGTDLFGCHKLALLEKAGVDTSGVVRADGREPCLVIVLVRGDGERTFLGPDGGRALQPSDLDESLIASSGLLHLDLRYEDAALAAATVARRHHVPVLLDADRVEPGQHISDRRRQIAANTDNLVCGAGFCQQLTGRDDPADALRATLDLGPRVVTQTLGGAGSITLDHNRPTPLHVPAMPTNVVDTTGAGDVFHGAYAFALSRGWPLEATVALATAVAACKCTRPGGRAGIPTLDEAVEKARAAGYDLRDLARPGVTDRACPGEAGGCS
jgi:sugar/nucleoside kinase (ribokinase family)